MSWLNPWYWISLVGSPEFWLAVSVAIAAFYAWKKPKGMKGFVVVFLISLAISYGIVIGLKDITNIPRPCDPDNPDCPEDSSFPSGHAVAVFTAFTATALFSKKRAIPILILALLVSWSRVALGVHTWADVIVGGLIGVTITQTVWFALKKFGKKIKLEI